MEKTVRCRRVWLELALLPILAVLIVVSSELLDLLIGITLLSAIICTVVFVVVAIIVIRRQIRYTLKYSVEEGKLTVGSKHIDLSAVTRIEFTKGVIFDDECNSLILKAGEKKVLLRVFSVRNEYFKPNKDFLELVSDITENCPQLYKTLPDIGKEHTELYVLKPAGTEPAAQSESEEKREENDLQ